MITREEYLKALDIVEAYHQQIGLQLDKAISKASKYKALEELEIGDLVEVVSKYAHVTNLTIGKTYEVILAEPTRFTIKTDAGIRREYRTNNSMFKALK